MFRYMVPAKFWNDHKERCPFDVSPEFDMAKEISTHGSRVLIQGNEIQIANLRGDAEFYADTDGPDECPPGLKASAAATVNALKKPIKE